MLYSYNDVTIIPEEISHITHRSECDPTDENGRLPIFTAPMSSIVNINNYNIYIKNHITPIIPRNIFFEDRLNLCKSGYWAAMSLDEFKNLDSLALNPELSYKICVDVANGHMASLYNAIKDVKKKFPNIIIMTGNIANPGTLKYASAVGVDYIRLGIGAGAGCITSSNTGIHYPMASLIAACKQTLLFCRDNIKKPKLIADGGIRNYSDVNKALALGADYVMIGGLFSKCLESSYEFYYVKGDIHSKYDPIYNNIIIKDWLNGDKKLYHKFYGMASKEGMKDLGLTKHTAEGISKYIEVKYTLAQWTKNMEDYLRSAMSYCDSKTLEDFIKNAHVKLMSNNALNSINK